VNINDKEANHGEGQAANLDSPGPAHEAQSLGLRDGRRGREADPRLPLRLVEGGRREGACGADAEERNAEAEGREHHIRAGCRALCSAMWWRRSGSAR
jgi:hypothetical protein